MTRKIFSIKSIREKRYRYASLDPYYAALMGEPEMRFVAMFYGKSGSGKSVFCLKFADYYARNFGKVLYNSHEERTGKTIQDRIKEYDIYANRLWVADRMSFDEMCKSIEKNYYRMVVIDSVQYMGFTMDQLKELLERFSKRHLAVVMVSFGTKLGSPVGGTDLLHASDIKGFFFNGQVHFISRYLNRPVNKQLFSGFNSSKQLTLF